MSVGMDGRTLRTPYPKGASFGTRAVWRVEAGALIAREC